MICEDGGCMAKLSGNKLIRVIDGARKLSGISDDDEVSQIGAGIFDDCAIIKGQEKNRLYSVDFGPLVGDDIETAGRIAVLNALSDIWVTGGKPEGALIILMASSDMTDEEIEILLSSIFKTCHDFGVKIYGGHSIVRNETIIGLSVIGSSDIISTKRKQNVICGDNIWISKPLGTGIALRGYANEILTQQQYQDTIAVMLIPNVLSNELISDTRIHAVTDITGYGLIGHLVEMLGNDKGAILFRDRIPMLNFLSNIAPGFAHSVYIEHNYQYALMHHRVIIDNNNITDLSLLDPQTNGPIMLIASPECDVAKKCGEFTCIGKVITDGKIVVEEYS